MATPIKITPVLKGNDAVFFNKQLAKSSKTVSGRSVTSSRERKKILQKVDKLLKSKTA